MRHSATAPAALAAACLGIPALAGAGETGGEAGEPDWDLALGLSYLATGGNTETSSAGFDAEYHQGWDRWRLEAAAHLLRATEEEETTAESSSLAVRGGRRLNRRLELAAGLEGERDRFAGIDLRTVADAGARWSTRGEGPWTLSSLAGLSWTREERVGPEPTSESLGGIVQVKAGGELSPSASLSSQLTYYPSFEETDDYRFGGKVALQASLNRRLAVRLGYELRFDNRPVEGFGTTDTSATASLVVRLGRRESP